MGNSHFWGLNPITSGWRSTLQCLLTFTWSLKGSVSCRTCWRKSIRVVTSAHPLTAGKDPSCLYVKPICCMMTHWNVLFMQRSSCRHPSVYLSDLKSLRKLIYIYAGWRMWTFITVHPISYRFESILECGWISFFGGTWKNIF